MEKNFERELEGIIKKFLPPGITLSYPWTDETVIPNGFVKKDGETRLPIAGYANLYYALKNQGTTLDETTTWFIVPLDADKIIKT